jgi:hypothetical protein
MGIPRILFVSNDNQRITKLQKELRGRLEVLIADNDEQAKKMNEDFPDICAFVLDADAIEFNTIVADITTLIETIQTPIKRPIIVATNSMRFRSKYESCGCGCDCGCPWDDLADIVISFVEHS